MTDTRAILQGMSVKVTKVTSQEGKRVGWTFFCPGCSAYHMYYTEPWTKTWKNPPEPGGVWTFNGDVEAPTFTPSLLIFEHKRPDGTIHQPRCHLFVTNGQIRYCGDSNHELKGKTVDMIEVGKEPY